MFRFLVIALITFNSFSLELDIFGPCSKEPLFSTTVELSDISNTQLNIGQATVSILHKNEIPFKGTARGLNSIYNSALGLDALEVISDTKMRSHGWCYSVNDEGPSVYPDQIPASNTDRITWYFCYVSYDSGNWSSQYHATNEIAPAQFCD